MGLITSRPSYTIFLADGLPDGFRVVDKSGWIGQAVICPRTRFPEAKANEVFDKTGVYVLCGPSEQGDLPTVYVGEGDPTRPRLEQHFLKKDFWTSLIVFTSKDKSLTKTHVQYLESRLVGLARRAKRSELDNNNDPQLPTLGVAEEAATEAFLEEMLLIYPLLGLTAFEVPRVGSQSTGVQDTTLYRKKAKEIVARGHDKAEGFVVLAGSIASQENMPSATPALRSLRERLVNQGVLVADGNHLTFTQDYTFNSSSQAAAVLVGGNVAGPTYWKDDQGRTLKAIQDAAIGLSGIEKTEEEGWGTVKDTQDEAHGLGVTTTIRGNDEAPVRGTAAHKPVPASFTKTYLGKDYTVETVEAGYRVPEVSETKVYKSLTAAAQAIRGNDKPINGWQFFGLMG